MLEFKTVTLIYLNSYICQHYFFFQKKNYQSTKTLCHIKLFLRFLSFHLTSAIFVSLCSWPLILIALLSVLFGLIAYCTQEPRRMSSLRSVPLYWVWTKIHQRVGDTGNMFVQRCWGAIIFQFRVMTSTPNKFSNIFNATTIKSKME